AAGLASPIATATSPYTRTRRSFIRRSRSAGATARPLATDTRPAAERPPGVGVALVIQIAWVGDRRRCPPAPGPPGLRRPVRAATRPGESTGHSAAAGVEKSMAPPRAAPPSSCRKHCGGEIPPGLGSAPDSPTLWLRGD